MIFSYRSIISAAPDGEDFVLIQRPEIPVTIAGPTGTATYIGLVDTGSDNTIIPKSIADDLGIAVQPTSGPAAKVFGGFEVQLLTGNVRLTIESESEALTWETDLYFFEFPTQEAETVILGHAGFLDYFTAIFDGLEGQLTLLPNAELPVVVPEQ